MRVQTRIRDAHSLPGASNPTRASSSSQATVVAPEPRPRTPWRCFTPQRVGSKGSPSGALPRAREPNSRTRCSGCAAGSCCCCWAENRSERAGSAGLGRPTNRKTHPPRWALNVLARHETRLRGVGARRIWLVMGCRLGVWGVHNRSLRQKRPNLAPRDATVGREGQGWPPSPLARQAGAGTLW